MSRTTACLSVSSLLAACSLFTEDLFENVEHFIDQDPDQLEVIYEPTDGHPISITADIHVQTADDEFLIESRNLQAMLTGLGLPR